MTDQVGNYNQQERRKEQRRKLDERRTDIRFEPTKEPRRKHRGRRNSDGDVWDKHEE